MVDPNPSAASASAAAAAKKRSRYTSVACNECKRRKIKCNGERPCERCGHQGLDCVYESLNFQDSEDYRRMASQIETLQGQVAELFALVKELRAERADGHQVGRALGNMEVDMAEGMRSAGLSSGSGDGGIEGLPDAHADGNGAGLGGGGEGGGGGVIGVNADASRQIDPAIEISSGDMARLMVTYRSRIQSIYPIVDMNELLYDMNRLTNVRDRILQAQAAQTTDWTNGALSTDTDFLRSIEGMTCKMVLAIAAYAQHPSEKAESAISCRLYLSYLEGWEAHEFKKGWETCPYDGKGEFPWKEMVRGLQLQALVGLWKFQYGEEREACDTMRELLVVFKKVNIELVSKPDFGSEAATVCLKLGSVIYSMYWRWRMLVLPTPRFDHWVEKSPPRRLNDGEEYEMEEDESSKLRQPLMEYGKLCSITCFAFEGTDSALTKLQSSRPPWMKSNAVDHVHRWQASWPMGLKSLASIRPGMLSSKPPSEQVSLSTIYLHAHFLRLAAVRYKRSGYADVYRDTANELFESAKWASNSITVLWLVHDSGKIWHSHKFLYNCFLIDAGSWIYELLADGTIQISDEVKMSLQKTLVLMETYCGDSERAKGLLGKLQESRRYLS